MFFTLTKKSLFTILYAFCMMAIAIPAYARKEAMIVVDASNGKILYAKNANDYAYPASLTKAMTVYMIFKALQNKQVTLKTKMKVSRNASNKEPSKLYLKAGSYITIENAIKALIVKSANDVATVVAEYFGKTETHFAKLMTRQARAMNMKRTSFKNASGLPHRRQITTARDMAQLGRRLLLDFPQYYHYFNLSSFRYYTTTIKGHNNILHSFNGADGIKTGYTKASGYNLLTSAMQNNRRVIAVVLGGRTAGRRDYQMLKLLKKYTKKASVFYYKTPETQPYVQMAKSVKTLSDNGLSASVPVPPKSPYQVMMDKNVKQTQRKEQFIKATQPEIIANWQIQVGAYHEKKLANVYAQKVYNALPSSMQDGTEYLVSMRRGNKKNIYRARIKGLSREEAEWACQELKKQSLECLPIRPT